jgi:hypothetical protein
MITSVKSFCEYARTSSFNDKMFEKCIGDMEQGLLHVDTVDCSGMTLGLILWNTLANQSFWDRYWALSPNVALFWRIVFLWRFLAVFSYKSSHCRSRLCNTSALWEDLGVLLDYAHIMPVWMQDEVHDRIRDSVRFAWIAAVVIC